MKVIDQHIAEHYAVYNADCVEILKTIPSNSIHHSIYSPPFSSLYVYSNSERDLGNSLNDEQFWAHYRFVIAETYRALMPGRIVAVHCMNLPTSKQHHGYIGLRDFRGEIIREHEKAGFIYHSEAFIWKDPVTAMQRTKALGLLHKQIKKDSCMSRMGVPDYLLAFRKPGDNPERVKHTDQDFPVKLWQEYASPQWDFPHTDNEFGIEQRDAFWRAWGDINPSNTLQRESAREHNDERHICPLQLQVIERAIHLWSNPNDIVLSPFAGIGSEGFVAVKMGRRYIGIELKASYYKQAALNLAAAVTQRNEKSLFDLNPTNE